MNQNKTLHTRKAVTALLLSSLHLSLLYVLLALLVGAVRLVLQADWQEAWHSPQPTPLFLRQALWIVLICFMVKTS